MALCNNDGETIRRNYNGDYAVDWKYDGDSNGIGYN